MPREVYIDPGIIKDTAEICKSLHLDKKILIVTGAHTYDVGAKPVIESLEKENIEFVAGICVGGNAAAHNVYYRKCGDPYFRYNSR